MQRELDPVVVTALKRKFGPVRVVGSLDIEGRGTVYELDHLDPIRLLDYVDIPTNIRPPFCAHPHCGVLVISIPIEGQDIYPWDNIHGNHKVLQSGGLYLLNSGSGCVHDEPTHIILPGPTRKVSWVNGKSPTTNGNRREMLQLILDPGINEELDNVPCQTQIVQPECIPCISNSNGVDVRVLLGSWKEFQSPVSDRITQNHPFLILHCRIRDNTSDNASTTSSILSDTKKNKLEDIPQSMSGLIYVISGSGRFNGTNANAGQSILIPIMSHSKHISPLEKNKTVQTKHIDIETKSCEETFLSFILIMGKPHNRQLHKLIGYGGALMHNSKDLVWQKMREYMKSPTKFGVNAVKKEAEKCNIEYKELPSSSFESWEMIGGFFNAGDNLYSSANVKARWKEKETVAPGNLVEKDADGVLRAPWGTWRSEDKDKSKTK